MRPHILEEEPFREAVKNSLSIRQALLKLGVIAEGGNYRVFHKYAKKYDVDTSHFTGQAWNKGKVLGPARPLEDYLRNEAPIHSHRLRQRLLQEGRFEHQCSRCKRRKWLGAAIPLELDHIDGNHENNALENLRLLCPNCHALTPTYRGRKQSRVA